MIFGSAVILNLIFLNVVKHMSLALIKDEKRINEIVSFKSFAFTSIDLFKVFKEFNCILL